MAALYCHAPLLGDDVPAPAQIAGRQFIRPCPTQPLSAARQRSLQHRITKSANYIYNFINIRQFHHFALRPDKFKFRFCQCFPDIRFRLRRHASSRQLPYRLQFRIGQQQFLVNALLQQPAFQMTVPAPWNHFIIFCLVYPSGKSRAVFRKFQRRKWRHEIRVAICKTQVMFGIENVHSLKFISASTSAFVRSDFLSGER